MTDGYIKGEFKSKHKRLRINYAQTLVYLCLAMVVVFALWLDQHNQSADERARCGSGVDVRNVQRATVDAIYTLATGSIQRDPDAPPLTEEERQQYNAYIRRVNDFRDNMYEKIKPSEQCAPYVEDDNVKPPTPPTPPIPPSAKEKA